MIKGTGSLTLFEIRRTFFSTKHQLVFFLNARTLLKEQILEWKIFILGHASLNYIFHLGYVYESSRTSRCYYGSYDDGHGYNVRYTVQFLIGMSRKPLISKAIIFKIFNLLNLNIVHKISNFKICNCVKSIFFLIIDNCNRENKKRVFCNCSSVLHPPTYSVSYYLFSLFFNIFLLTKVLYL